MKTKLSQVVAALCVAVLLAGLVCWRGEGFAIEQPGARASGTEPGTLRFAAGRPIVAAVEDAEQEIEDEPAHEQRLTQSRSSLWPTVREKHLAKHPKCEACGSKAKPGKPLQVHHIIPFSVDANGDADGDGTPNELDPDNLITLCVDGVGHCNCHLLFGHGGNFRCHNPNVVRDAKRLREMLDGRTCDRRE